MHSASPQKPPTKTDNSRKTPFRNHDEPHTPPRHPARLRRIAERSSRLGPEKGQGESTTFATVNGKAIPKVRADALIAAQAAQGQPDSPELRKAVREELVRREVLAQEAQKKGLDKKPEIQGQMDLARQGVLIGAYLNDYVKTHPVTDDAIKKEYEAIKAKLGDKEYKARHILVEKEDEAKAIIDKLKKGEKFEDLAKQSKDPGSKERGGDLGWANPASLRAALLRGHDQARKGQVHRNPGQERLRLARHPARRHPRTQAAGDRRSQGRRSPSACSSSMVEKHIDELRGKAKVE